MEISKESIDKYRRAYKEDTGEEISFDEASEIVHRMLRLFEILAKPLPSEVHRCHPDLEDA